jgi:hypothetical protein
VISRWKGIGVAHGAGYRPQADNSPGAGSHQEGRFRIWISAAAVYDMAAKLSTAQPEFSTCNNKPATSGRVPPLRLPAALLPCLARCDEFRVPRPSNLLAVAPAAHLHHDKHPKDGHDQQSE